MRIAKMLRVQAREKAEQEAAAAECKARREARLAKEAEEMKNRPTQAQGKYARSRRYSSPLLMAQLAAGLAALSAIPYRKD